MSDQDFDAQAVSGAQGNQSSMLPPPMASDLTVDQERLIAALSEIEHFVGHGGWDQPSRLFALAPTADLLAAEPALAGQVTMTSQDQLSSIEQEDFHPGQDIVAGLADISWPETVVGVAVMVERTFLPAGIDVEIPSDPDEAADFVAKHPQHEEIRVVVGALRNGTQYGLARLKSNPEDLLAGEDLVPGLGNALAHTFDVEATDGSADSGIGEN